MNNNNILPENNESQCCPGYCTQIFQAGEQQVVNAYACTERTFSAASIWNIQRKQRSANLRLASFEVV